ncbi:hypothetical protein D9613_006268 [Agrocybe pediades]|uniref:Uncharacterized protein n=1 Tax=Agrocybe pediades TaxID=84607 RepID=A0A8H4QUF8_9AGAR|nr:hypothetical protein D9613_006268 [Agrocybe pediades]
MMRRKWSSVGFAYLVARYFATLAQIPLLLIGPNSRHSQSHNYSLHECRLWEIYRGVVSAILIVALDAVLIARGFYIAEIGLPSLRTLP